ncbi:MAG: protein phosphatase 2C domain-containing protein [Deltaproteobacteria bacterium]|nr:protein phosphatase 2C domain-containing protein [Deltaproteobacteria bacterium]
MYLASENSLQPIKSTSRSSAFVLKEALLEQGSGSVNEDTMAIGEDCYVVCDGATTISHGQGGREKSGGLLAASIAARVLSQNSSLPLFELAKRANSEIFQAMDQAGVDFGARENLWSTSFAAVRVNGETIEWCQTGDCLIMLIYDDGTGKLVTPPSDHDRETLRQWKQVGTNVHTTIHETLTEQIAAVRRKMNVSYGALNGETEALEYIATGREKATQINDILLFSDGLFPTSEDPDKPLNTSLIQDFYSALGLVGLLGHNRSIQQTDPRCCRYPRFKMYDDVSAIALTRSDRLIR